VAIHAVCDTHEKELAAARERLGARDGRPPGACPYSAAQWERFWKGEDTRPAVFAVLAKPQVTPVAKPGYACGARHGSPEAGAALAFKAAAIRRRFAARSFSQELDQSYGGFNSRSWFSLWGPPFPCVMGALGG